VTEIEDVQELIAAVLVAKDALDLHGPTRIQAENAAQDAADREDILYKTYQTAKRELAKVLGPGVI
jgi:hypothetical protein